MRRLLALCTAALLLVAASARASEGVNLRWSDCIGDGGAINRNFACNTTSGSHVLVGSFELGAPIQASGLEIHVDVQTQSATLPAWWQFKNVSTCRQASLSMNVGVSPIAVVCVDWASGKAVGGIGAYDIGFISPNRARIRAAAAVPQAALADLAAGQEYYSFTFVINNAKTVGADACAGCSVPANLLFASLKVTTPVSANDRVLSNPTNGFDSNFATWQGGFPTATRRGTWGAVKALFR